MRKTYKSSNVRFCMEDENQRRTWEYLQSLTRKDCSYGKALSDAFVLVLDRKVSKGEAEELCLSTSVAEKAISEGNIPCGKMQEALLRQLTKELEEHALRTVWGEDTPHSEQCEEETEQVPETDMSDAMMSMALAMGE